MRSTLEAMRRPGRGRPTIRPRAWNTRSSGPRRRIPDLKPLEVDDWGSFRERYADAFGPFLDDLRRQAAHAWEVEALIEEFGEGIQKGRPSASLCSSVKPWWI